MSVSAEFDSWKKGDLKSSENQNSGHETEVAQNRPNLSASQGSAGDSAQEDGRQEGVSDDSSFNESMNFRTRLEPVEEAFLKLFKMMDYRRIKTRPEALGKNVEFISAMTCRQERVLVTIGDSEGLHPNDLARELDCSIQSISATIEILVNKDLVLRLPNPKDRRSCCLHLTARGKEICATIKRGLQRASHDLLDGLSVEDQEAFIRIVGHFYQVSGLES